MSETVGYRKYNAIKRKFFSNKCDLREWNSGLAKDGSYSKVISNADGAWYEVMTVEYETFRATGELHGVTVTFEQEVKFLKTEFWSTEDPTSRYYYERW